jgi:hypothetical protein
MKRVSFVMKDGVVKRNGDAVNADQPTAPTGAAGAQAEF